jgi:hypothetical protein
METTTFDHFPIPPVVCLLGWKSIAVDTHLCPSEPHYRECKGYQHEGGLLNGEGKLSAVMTASALLTDFKPSAIH